MMVTIRLPAMSGRAATVAIAFGRMQVDQLRLRSLLLLGSAFWILHDFAAGAWIALGADIGTAVMGTAALSALLIRVRIEWRYPVHPMPVA